MPAPPTAIIVISMPLSFDRRKGSISGVVVGVSVDVAALVPVDLVVVTDAAAIADGDDESEEAGPGEVGDAGEDGEDGADG